MLSNVILHIPTVLMLALAGAYFIRAGYSDHPAIRLAQAFLFSTAAAILHAANQLPPNYPVSAFFN